MTADVRFVIIAVARKRAVRAGGGIDGGLRLGQMAFADGNAVINALLQFR